MHKDLHQFYSDRISHFTQQHHRVNLQLRWSGLMRLLLFIIATITIYMIWSQWQWVVSITTVALVVFLWLVSRHEHLRQHRDLTQSLIDVNTTELQLLDRNYKHRDDGAQYIKFDHEYCHDIDLLGNGSFYQYINRTVIPDGTQALVDRLLSNDIDNIQQRQQAIKDLADKVDFRQHYSARAALLDYQQPTSHIVDWVKGYQRFVPKIFNWLSWLWFASSIITVVAYFNNWISGYVLAALFFIGLAITSRYVKRINQFCTHITRLELFFKQYAQLILAIENQDFASDLLQKYKSNIITDQQPASSRLAELAAMIGRLDQRNNMLFGVFANGFGLWDLKQVYSIEHWINDNANHIEQWLWVVAQIDALNTLANFAYNHPEYVYPVIGNTPFNMQAIQAQHPLLDPSQVVGNDINISSGEFFIITGANMAGKSTFLRTVAISIVMANSGLPVAAQSMSYSPVKLITSMRTSDSLSDDQSYFFSELKRLKFIVNQLEHEPYFIILDEILKGTNSQDKANGSRKLIEKLSHKQATGIIATHDLSLTEVAHQYDTISNYYFDADITNNQLSFDYTFNKGVATNMNASFLLREMGIVD